MKKFLLALSCFTLGSAAFCADVLIKNGNFEEGLKNWVVPGWIKNAATPILDNSDMPGPGKASLKLVAADVIKYELHLPPGLTAIKN